MRDNCADDFNASSIFIDDRTTYFNNLRIDWALGAAERYYIINYFEILDNKITYYGSSAEDIYVYRNSSFI